MNEKIGKIFIFLTLALFAIAPFIMSYENIDKASLISASVLPSFISTIFGNIRWVLFVFITLISILFLGFKQNNFKISYPVFLFFLFYLVQLLYALVDGNQVERFILLSVFSLFIPPFIGRVISISPNLLKYLSYFIIIFLIISIFLNGHIILSGQRFFGFANNPNTYGFFTIFWLVIILISRKKNMIGKKTYIIAFVIIILTTLFSGSRNALIGMFLLLIFNFRKSKQTLLWVIIFSFSIITVISFYFDISFVSNRLFNVTNSYEDTGRYDIWQRAYSSIQNNLWLGNGMNANFLIANTDNMHNSYIRFVLNMGLFFTLLSFLFYFKSIYVVLKKRKIVPPIFGVFLLIYAVMNMGEDYFVGVGSTAFIYILFIFGFINFYCTKNTSNN